MAASGGPVIVWAGMDRLQRMLKRLGPTGELDAAIDIGLFAYGQKVLSLSMPLVPVDTGVLRGSGKVRHPRAKEVVVGYGGAAAAYGWSVHENPAAGRTGGQSPTGQPYDTWATTGQWKYLEQPVKQLLPYMPVHLAHSLDLHIKRAML